MTSFRIRPRFKQIVHQNPQLVQSRLETQLSKSDAPCKAVVLPGHVTLKMPKADQHIWSPQLSLTFEEHDEGTLIRGLYGPNPTLWALFFMAYASITILSLFIGVWGLSRLSLDQDAPMLWALPVLAVIFIVLYFFAQLGQKFGAEQTFILHHFYENAIGDKVKIS